MTIAGRAVRENATVRNRGGKVVDVNRIVIIGGGPAGYEAALVAAQLDAEVTLVEATGAGGACVLSDCVPSKTFIASSDVVTTFGAGEKLGVHARGAHPTLDAAAVHARVKQLALAQSGDIAAKLATAGVELVAGHARLGVDTLGHTHQVVIEPYDAAPYTVDAKTVLIATGATPRVLPEAHPDGHRILTWRDVYDLPELPERLIVVGSGVTGAEFASAYLCAGVEVTLISSRDRVMPHEDPDAAATIEKVFLDRGMRIRSNARAVAARRTASGVVVELADGEQIAGSHVLMAVGSVPNTATLGLSEYGVGVGPGGYVTVDRVSRTNVPGIYAAGDCTGVLALASVAAMQGRIAMWHALGEAVAPLRLTTVAAMRLHRSRTRLRRGQPGGHRLGPGARPHGDPATRRERPREDGRSDRRFRQALLPSGLRARHRRCRGGAAGQRADPAGRFGGGEPPHGEPARAHDHDLSVVVRFTHRGGPSAHAARVRIAVTGSHRSSRSPRWRCPHRP